MTFTKRMALALSLLLLLTAAGCFGGGESSSRGGSSQASPEEDAPVAPDPEYPVRVGAVQILARPGRVVSLAPSITEKICDLGLEARLAGRSSARDVHPATVRSLPQYGTPQLPDLDALRGLGPQLVLTVEDPSPLAREALDEMGATVLVVPSYCRSVDELKELYMTLACVLEGRTSGAMIGERFIQRFEAGLEEVAAAYPEARPLRALYLRLLPFQIATGDTLEGELLERVGFTNMAADQESFWTYDADYANSAGGREAFMAVDIIFMDGQDVTMTDLEQSQFYKGLPATLKDWYIYIDVTAFEAQSMRMLDELAKMVTLETVGERPTEEAA